MKFNKDEEKRFVDAKKKVEPINFFYLHLVLYIIAVVLISYNFYILEEGLYKSNITALNMSVIVFWTIAINIHGWTMIKGKLLFKKSWEDIKIEKILKEKEESTF